MVDGDLIYECRFCCKVSFVFVTSYTTFMVMQQGMKNPDSMKAISRHEILCTLEDVVREASLLLKPGGRFYLVHRPRRLAEIVCVLRTYSLEPKRMKLVHPFVGREANMVLLEAVRGGGVMMKVEAPIIVFEKQGVYSEEIRTTYGY